MLRFSLTAILLAFTASAAAEDFSYNWLQFGYGIVDFDDIDVDGDGFGFGGSFEINDDFFIFGNYSQADLDFGIDSTSLGAGFGFNTAVAENADLFATLSYEYVEVDVPFFNSADEDGFGIGVGMRFMPTTAVELTGSINYVDVGDDDTSLSLAGIYNFNPQFSAGLGGTFGDDATSWTLFGRWYFGR